MILAKFSASNFVERLTVLNDRFSFDEAQVREALSLGADDGGLYEAGPAGREASSGLAVTRDEMIAVLERNHGRKKATARELGISTTTLWRRLNTP